MQTFSIIFVVQLLLESIFQIIISVVVNFWPKQNPPHQNLSREQLPRGCFSSRGNNCPEDSPSFENIATLRLVLPSRARWLLQSTPLIFAYIYIVCYAATSSHVLNVATILTPMRTVIEGSRNRSRHQGQNSSCYGRISTCRSCNYWNPHDPHHQWSLPGPWYIYMKRREKRRWTTRKPKS